MSKKDTVIALANSQAGKWAAIIGISAVALYWLGSKAAAAVADAVVQKQPSLYEEGKQDRLIFGFINIDEPFALTKRLFGAETLEDKKAAKETNPELVTTATPGNINTDQTNFLY